MRLILFLFALFTLTFSRAQVVINEYSCANVSTLADNYGEFEDWIEFYNPSLTPFNLAGYHLSDKLGNPIKYQFLSGTVPAQGYLVVYCSGRDEISAGNIHVNFKMTQTKPEALVFADPFGSVLESHTLVRTQADHSRGRTTDAAPAWGLFLSPTPGSSNTGPVQEYTARPSMNQPAGFYNGAISVAIGTTDPLGTIYYTLDGSEPTTASTLYTTPITISANTVVRARSFSSNPNVPPSFIESNTYFIDSAHSIAVLSIFGDDVATLFNGTQIDPDATIEYFDANKVFRTEANGRANEHGNDSWAYDQRGIDFIAEDEKGYSYAFTHKLFSRKTRDEFQRLIIKGGANDNYPFETGGAHIRDAYVATISHDGDMYLDERTYEPVIVYVNGAYWGVYEIREKVDDHDFTSYYADQGEFDIQFLKTWGATWSEYGGAQAQADWDSLKNFITTNDMSVPANYEYVDSLLNIKSLVDYFILNSYIVCMDWLNWNTAWWRGLNPEGDKKKWRYTLWDMDASFGHYINYTGIPNTTATADPCDPESLPDPGGQGHTELISDLQENPDFVQYYKTRWIDLTNSTLSCQNMLAKLDSLILEISPEMPGQIARWGGTVAEWDTNVIALRDFILERCAEINTGMMDCYDLTGPYTITIDVDPPGAGYVELNSLNLTNLPWTGTYFGGVINSLTAIPLSEEEYTFDYWEMTTSTPNPSDKDSAITTEFVANDVIIAHFKPPQSIFVPTGFSPNGDGLNDKLAIMGQGITSVSFAVYDRWGQRVFFTTDPELNWDGTFNGQVLNSGVFAYKMEAVLRDGTIINQTGNITLMR